MEVTISKDIWTSKKSCDTAMFDQIVNLFKNPGSRMWSHTGSVGAILNRMASTKNGIEVIGGEDEKVLNDMGLTTAFTNFKCIRFTEKFLNKLTPLGALFVLLHESCHIAFLHKSRKRRNYDHQIWNVAGDARINGVLWKYIIPALTGIKNVTGDMLFVDKPFGIGFTNDTKNWLKDIMGPPEQTEEDFYYILEQKYQEIRDKQEQQPGQGQPGQGGGSGQGQGQGSGDGKGSGNGQGQGQGSGSGKASGKSPQQSKMPGMDDGFDDHDVDSDMRKKLEAMGRKDLADKLGLPKGDSPAEQQAEKDAEKQIVKEANEASRTRNAMRGRSGIGSHIDGMISETLRFDDKEKAARVTWHSKVGEMMFEVMRGKREEDWDLADEITMLSRDMDTAEECGLTEIYCPEWVQRGGEVRIGVVMDASGSVQPKELLQFMTEMRGMITDALNNNENVVKISLYFADTIVRKDPEHYEFPRDGDLPDQFTIPGRGGTDMLTPTAQAISSAKEPYHLLTIFSDGDFHPFTYSDLVEKIEAIDPQKVADIPHISNINSKHNFSKQTLREVAESFDAGKGFSIFNLQEMENNDVRVEMDITEDGVDLSM